MPRIPNGMKPVVSGYSMDDPGGVMRTEVAGGAARYALDYDRGPQRFSVTLILDAMEFSVWTAFYHHVIRKGTIAFDMQLDSGFGAQDHSVNIVPESYSAARTSGIMTVVTFTAEAENKVYEMSASAGALLVDFYNAYGRGSSALLDRLAIFANSDTLVLDF